MYWVLGLYAGLLLQKLMPSAVFDKKLASESHCLKHTGSDERAGLAVCVARGRTVQLNASDASTTPDDKEQNRNANAYSS